MFSSRETQSCCLYFYSLHDSIIFRKRFALAFMCDARASCVTANISRTITLAAELAVHSIRRPLEQRRHLAIGTLKE